MKLSAKCSAVLMLSAIGAVCGGCLDRELKALNPCLVSGVTLTVRINNIDKLDLLFMVDNSGSMKEEQQSLQDQFPKLVKTLTTGVRVPGEPMAFSPVTDLHVGVVSSDMGTPGVAGQMGCSADGGDDGRLQHTPHGAGCAATYPPFLSFNKGGDTNAFANDFGCIALLGTNGCGFEQQLEAPLKALWPSVFTDKKGNVVAKNPITFLSTTQQGTLGRGDQPGNIGFLRNNPITGLSLIAIVVVTDEEDCSSRVNDHLRVGDTKDINLRCFHNPQNLFDIKERYLSGFQGLRPDNPDLVLFAAIVGVPTDLVDAKARAGVEFTDPAQRDAYYDRMLADSRMQETVDSQADPMSALNLRPSCARKPVGGGMSQTAFPPRRIVQLAKAFGENGVVQSICQDDFGPAMEAIIEAIGGHLKPVCLPRPLVRKANGTVGCNVVWELPKPGTAPDTTPTRCSQASGFLELVDAATPTSGERCKVLQLPVTNQTMPTGASEGWYYDNFSSEISTLCRKNEPQRVAFTNGAKPTTGVVVKLECLNEVQMLPNLRDDLKPSSAQVEIGTQCGKDTKSASGSGEEKCELVRTDGSTDNSMFCHPERNVCVKACVSSTDCPAAWVCDMRPETLATAGTGGAFCVNPTCGTDG